VDVVSDIALLGEERRPRVQTDAHLGRPGGEPLRHRRSRLERPWRGRKSEEERVSLSIDLDAALAGARFSDQAPVLGESLRIALRAELVQQLGRALDVGEEEGDRAPGKV